MAIFCVRSQYSWHVRKQDWVKTYCIGVTSIWSAVWKCVCWWRQSSVDYPPHVCRWSLNQHQPPNWKRDFVIFCVSGMSRDDVPDRWSPRALPLGEAGLPERHGLDRWTPVVLWGPGTCFCVLCSSVGCSTPNTRQHRVAVGWVRRYRGRDKSYREKTRDAS